jgi:PAS domain S-box-containing protein
VKARGLLLFLALLAALLVLHQLNSLESQLQQLRASHAQFDAQSELLALLTEVRDELDSTYDNLTEGTRSARLDKIRALVTTLKSLSPDAHVEKDLDVLLNGSDLTSPDLAAIQPLTSATATLEQSLRSLRRTQIPKNWANCFGTLFVAFSATIVLVVCLAGLFVSGLKRSARPRMSQARAKGSPAETATFLPLAFTQMALATRSEDGSPGISARGYTERVLQSLSNLLVLTARDGSIQMVNNSVCQTLGYSNGELLGKPFTVLLGSEGDPTSRPSDGLEAQYLKKDGSGIPVLVSCSAVPDSKGEIDGFVIVAQNIQQQKRHERQLRLNEKRLKNLAEKLVSTQESERRRIARDLHDTMLQSIIGTELQLTTHLKRLKKLDSDVGIEPIEVSIELLREAVSQGRLLINDLRPPILDKFGLVPSLEQEAKILARQLQISVEFSACEDIPSLPESVETTLFRICQESFNNIRKHSKANKVKVSLSLVPEGILLCLEDDGVGFEPGDETSGVGLGSMRERAELQGGRFEIFSEPGHGTKATAFLPIER